jgi:adenosylhomocysteine nucleosidase
MKRVLILTAMASELAAVVSAMTSRAAHCWGQVDVHQGVIEHAQVMALATGVGKVRASAGAQYAIDRFSPCLVLFVGTAGALDLHMSQGQVIVGNRIVEHDFDMSALAASPTTAHRRWTTSPVLLSQVVDAAKRAIGDENVRAGTILTGDQVVVDADRRDQLRKNFGGDCIEMEGAAVASVCHQNEVGLAVVRIVSDQADASAPQQFAAQLPAVSKLTRDIVREILSGDGMRDEKKIDSRHAPRPDSRPEPGSTRDQNFAVRPLFQYQALNCCDPRPNGPHRTDGRH